MHTLTKDELTQVSAGFKISHKIVGAIVGSIAATITGGPVGLGYFLSSAIMAEGAFKLTDMFNQHEFDLNAQYINTGGIIWHHDFMW